MLNMTAGKILWGDEGEKLEEPLNRPKEGVVCVVLCGFVCFVLFCVVSVVFWFPARVACVLIVALRV